MRFECKAQKVVPAPTRRGTLEELDSRINGNPGTHTTVMTIALLPDAHDSKQFKELRDRNVPKHGGSLHH